MDQQKQAGRSSQKLEAEKRGEKLLFLACLPHNERLSQYYPRFVRG
jgi:hypothetical protein